jgi:hypothetical protein
VPTEFCPWHVYSPASRRPTGRSCNDSCKLAISDRPARRHTMLAGGLASASHRKTNESLPSSRSIWGAPSKRIVGASEMTAEMTHITIKCFRSLGSHFTSSRPSTAIERAAYDSCSAKHLMWTPCRSFDAGICTTEAADQVRGLSGSVALVCGCSGEISWSPEIAITRAGEVFNELLIAPPLWQNPIKHGFFFRTENSERI